MWHHFARLMVTSLRAREISWKARGRRQQEVGRPKWQVVSVQSSDRIMNHVGGFAMASWNFRTHRGANAGLVVCYQTKPKENRATCVARCVLCIQKRGDCAVYVADYSTTPKFNRQYERSALSQTPLPSRSPNGGFSSPKNSSKNERSAGSTSLLKSKSPTA